MMKKYVVFLLLMIFIILTPYKATALCDYKEIARLKAIANNVTLSTDYVEKNNKVEFFITFTNLHPEIYIKDATSYTYYYYNSKANNPKEMVISSELAGKSIRYEFYAKDATCGKDALVIKYATLPPYNRYYNDPLCEGIEEYSLCQKWVRMNLSYSSFKKSIEAYKNPKKDNPTIETPKEEKINLDFVAQFLEKYYVYILLTIIVVCLVSIYRISRKDDFDFK